MPPRDYSHQNLRNRSFKNQDLTGANFSYSDLRGCDFSGATLTRANFQACKTGQSRRQILMLIAGAVALAGAGAFSGTFASTFAFTFSGAVVAATAGAIAFAGTFAGVIAVAIGVAVGFALTIAAAVAAVATFTQGKMLEGVTLSLLFLLLLGCTNYCLLKLFKTIRSATGTSFEKAQLSYANFSNATLVNTDFSDADTALTSWTNATFVRCTLPQNFRSYQALKLMTSRDGHRQDYTHLTLKNLNLQAVDLTRATLFHANLNGSNLKESQLNESNLAHAQALGVDFSEANLTGACIQNWGINSETKFINVRCDYIYLEPNQQERKPASGFFQPGDFEKLVHQFTTTLDFLFRNGIDPVAFDFALKKLLNEHEDAELSLHSLVNIGDGDRLVRFNVGNEFADKGAMHTYTMQEYEYMQNQLRSAEEKNRSLEQLIDHAEEKVAIYKNHVSTLSLLLGKFNSPTYNFHIGDIMTEANKTQIGSIGRDASGISGGDNTGVAGKDITGAAGGDISGTLTVTLGQLAEAKDPKVLELAELLQQAKTAITQPDSGLSEADQQKALKHLDNIGKLATDPKNPDLLEKAGTALDALPTIARRSDNLVAFAEKFLPTFTAGVKAIFAVLGAPL